MVMEFKSKTSWLLAFFLLTLHVAQSHTAFAKTEDRFHRVSQKIHQLYQPVFSRNGHQLSIKARWQSARKNAFATRDMEDHPIIVVHGGMLRHPLLDSDALAAVLCHELGHFLGGTPKARRGNSQRRSWSSVEGQADYYAATHCLKEIFNNDAENQKKMRSFDPEIRQTAKQRCGDDAQCIRIAVAGLKLTRLFAEVKFRPEPHLHLHDSHQVQETLMHHPSPQCRLDTFVAGARCQENEGVCSEKNGQEQAARPRCWFAP